MLKNHRKTTNPFAKRVISLWGSRKCNKYTSTGRKVFEVRIIYFICCCSIISLCLTAEPVRAKSCEKSFLEEQKVFPFKGDTSLLKAVNSPRDLSDFQLKIDAYREAISKLFRLSVDEPLFYLSIGQLDDAKMDMVTDFFKNRGLKPFVQNGHVLDIDKVPTSIVQEFAEVFDQYSIVINLRGNSWNLDQGKVSLNWHYVAGEAPIFLDSELRVSGISLIFSIPEDPMGMMKGLTEEEKLLAHLLSENHPDIFPLTLSVLERIKKFEGDDISIRIKRRFVREYSAILNVVKQNRTPIVETFFRDQSPKFGDFNVVVTNSGFVILQNITASGIEIVHFIRKVMDHPQSVVNDSGIVVD